MISASSWAGGPAREGKNVLKTPWWTNAIALGVGALAVFLLVVVPAGNRAAADLAKSNADYLSVKGQLDASAGTVTQLTGELANKNSQLSSALSQLSSARANASGLAAANSQLAGQLAELKSVIAAGASGLADDEQSATELTSLLESSLELAGKLQVGQ